VATAIPYGTIEPWWKAAFVCGVFAIFILAVIENLLNPSNRIPGAGVLLPMLAFTVLALIQTINLRPGHSDQVLARIPWNAISADPYQTGFFILQLLALTACLALLYRYAASERRIQVLIYVVLGVAMASAIYGVLRQTLQQEPGFLLPLTKPKLGYGQFINKNHFAYLMEMAFGLGVGIVLSGGVRRDRVMIYVALLLPVWIGLVLSNSRGGILAMLAQVVVAVLLLTGLFSGRDDNQGLLSRYARSPVLRMVLVSVLVGGVLVGTFWVGGDRLLSSFESARNELNPEARGLREGATRNEIWRATWKMFAAHPILGVGLGGYWIAITAYHDASGALTPQEAHNDYLELLSSGGLVGFAIGVWFAIVVFRMIRRNLSTRNGFGRAVCIGAVLGIVGIAVHSLVDFGLHLMINALLFLTLVMMATVKLNSNSETL
jgi:O-antigen ligase